MSILLIPIAPLNRTKSRLSDCFTRAQLIELTIAMFKDLAKTLTKVTCYNETIFYCNSPEILELVEDFGFIGIKEEIRNANISFDNVIENLNNIAIDKYNAHETVICFLDLVLINYQNFHEIHTLLQKNQIVICPAINSAGISILGRNPPDIIASSYSNPEIPSLVSLVENAKKKKIEKISIYDSFRASFDLDIKQDLILAYEYLKIFDLTSTETFQFLENNLNGNLHKVSPENNRELKIVNKNKELLK